MYDISVLQTPIQCTVSNRRSAAEVPAAVAPPVHGYSVSNSKLCTGYFTASST